MSTLEHLVENTIYYIKDNDDKVTYDEVIKHIENDINFQYVNISAEDCYTICYYVYDAFIRCNMWRME